jgi:hypothetical protein
MTKERSQNNTTKYLSRAGDIIIDLGKLVFAGVVLNIAINGPVKAWILLLSGVIFTLLAFVIGVWMSGFGEEK